MLLTPWSLYFGSTGGLKIYRQGCYVLPINRYTYRKSLRTSKLDGGVGEAVESNYDRSTLRNDVLRTLWCSG